MSSSAKDPASKSVDRLFDDDKAEIVRRIRSTHMPAIDENVRQCTASTANIGISQLSVPLVWNREQHFKSKGDHRTYSMFAVLHTKTQVVDSKMITNVDRSITDVLFPEAFVFEGEPDDFCIEISLYAARTDQVLSDGGGSLRAKISRSLGRKFGSNLKTQLSEPRHKDTVLGGTYFNLLARALVVINDAGNMPKVHDLQMSAFADLSGPPLYGHIFCRLVVQPNSVLRPLAEGRISVRPLIDEKKISNVFSRIQAGNLTCYDDKGLSEENILLQVPITPGSKVVSTSWTNTFLLSTKQTVDADAFQVFISTEDEETFQRWRNSTQKQIVDSETWGEFAYNTSTKLAPEKRKDPVKETMSRAAGSRLYDKISIVGTVSKSTLSPAVSSYCPRELSPLRDNSSRTAPTRRNRQRANVLDLFVVQPISSSTPRTIPKTGSLNSNTESPATYTPISTRIRDTMMANAPETTSRQSERTGTFKKSWSRSLGDYIGRKISSSNTSSAQITRL